MTRLNWNEDLSTKERNLKIHQETSKFICFHRNLGEIHTQAQGVGIAFSTFLPAKRSNSRYFFVEYVLTCLCCTSFNLYVSKM